MSVYTYRVEDMDAFKETLENVIWNRQMRSYCEIYEGKTMFIISKDGIDYAIAETQEEARKACSLGRRASKKP